MYRIAAVLVVVGATWALVRGPAEAEEKGGLPADLARVPGKAFLMVSLRPGDLWEHELAKGIRAKMGKDASFIAQGVEKSTGLAPAATERVTYVVNQFAPGGPGEPLMFVAAKGSFDRAKLLATIVPGGEEKTHAGHKYVANERKAVVILDDKHYVQGTVGDIQSILDAGPVKADAAMMPALKLAAGKHAAVVALIPEPLEKLADELPADAEPFKPLIQTRLGVLTVDAGSSAKVSLRLAFPGPGEAKAGARAVEAARKMGLRLIDQLAEQVGKLPEAAELVKLARQAGKELEKSKVVPAGDAVTAAFEMKLDDKTLGPVLGESLAKVRVAAARMESANHLKQIGLAMHNYHDTNNHFPPQAVYDKDGKALLSWRVLLLPYLDQDALYREFKLDEAWDSPHNKKLLAKMPQVFKLPGATPKHQYGTYYQVFHGKGAAFEGKTGNTIASFTDGTSNTILAVEAGNDVPWTKPEDVPFDPAKDVPQLSRHFGKGGHALFADGSVRFLSDSINKDTLKALVTRAGGEVIPNDD
ncbi:MAG: DUF1559 domain-containing protein [Gemmataceae bacterium]